MFAAIVGQSWATAAHPYNLEINGIDWAGRPGRLPSEPHLVASSLTIEMPGPGSNGSLHATLYDPDTAIVAVEWDEVRFIEHAASRPILFGGFVQSVRYIVQPGRAGRDVVLTCMGYGVLLDKKVFTGDPRTGASWYPPGVLPDWINRMGGRISALAPTFAAGSPVPMDATYSIAMDGFNSLRIDVSPGWTPAAPVTLRSAVGELLTNMRVYIIGGEWLNEGPITYAYWVDSCARLVAVPNFSNSVAASIYACNFDSGAVPGIAVDMVGTYHVEQLEYEREDTDRFTSAYVQGDTDPIYLGEETVDANRIVTSSNMRNGNYTIAHQRPAWGSGFIASVSHTLDGTVDDLGKILIRGSDLYGNVQTETITPDSGAKAIGSQVWRNISRVTGQSWKTSAGADQITVGHMGDSYAIGVGTGWYREPGLPRAGDLEAVVSNPASITAADVSAAGSGQVSETSAVTARGSVTLSSDTPLDIWPGRHISVDAPAVDLTSSQGWRMTAVRIVFRTATNRTYEIDFGGNLPAPSMARRQGRYKVIGPPGGGHRL